MMALEIRNVRLADTNAFSRDLYTVRCQDGKVTEILFVGDEDSNKKACSIGTPSTDTVDGNGGLLLPS